MNDKIDVLAVMDAMALSAERLAAGEVVTSCAATVEVARQTRAAIAELIAERDRLREVATAAASLAASLPSARWDQGPEKNEAVLQTILGTVSARLVMKLRTALARVGGA